MQLFGILKTVSVCPEVFVCLIWYWVFVPVMRIECWHGYHHYCVDQRKRHYLHPTTTRRRHATNGYWWHSSSCAVHHPNGISLAERYAYLCLHYCTVFQPVDDAMLRRSNTCFQLVGVAMLRRSNSFSARIFILKMLIFELTDVVKQPSPNNTLRTGEVQSKVCCPIVSNLILFIYPM